MALNTKRMQTFFNDFLVTTVSFLNQFSSECEDKFFELERKLNKIESNLIIVEEKVITLLSQIKKNSNIFIFVACVSSNRGEVNRAKC